MDIEQLIARRDALIADVATAFSSRAPDAAAFGRPLALYEAQAGRVRARIEALAQAKKDHATQIDAEIKDLEGELEGLAERLKNDRRLLTPLLEASANAKKPTRAGGDLVARTGPVAPGTGPA